MQNKINKELYIILLEFVINFKVESDSHDKYNDNFKFSGYESSQSDFDSMNETLSDIAESMFVGITSFDENILDSLIEIRKSLNVDLNEKIELLEEQLSNYK